MIHPNMIRRHLKVLKNISSDNSCTLCPNLKNKGKFGCGGLSVCLDQVEKVIKKLEKSIVISVEMYNEIKNMEIE